MEFGNVQRFEIVVRRFDFRAFYDGEADGDKNIFDFLENLANQVMGADGANDSWKRKIDAFACERGFFRAGIDLAPEILKRTFNIRPERIQFLPYYLL